MCQCPLCLLSHCLLSLRSCCCCWLVLRLLWTKLLGRIHHNRLRQLITLQLSSELFQLFLLHLPPSTQQVQVRRNPPAWLHKPPHYHTVWAGRVEEIHAEAETTLHIKGKSAAFSWDVVPQVLALITKAVDLGIRQCWSFAGVGEVHRDAVSTSQSLHRWWVIETACD